MPTAPAHGTSEPVFGRAPAAVSISVTSGELLVGFWPDSSVEIEVLGAADELLGAPDELLGAPDELLGAPDELLGAPDELLGAPDELLGEAEPVV